MMTPKPQHFPKFVKSDGTEAVQTDALRGTGPTLSVGTWFADLGPGVEIASKLSPHFRFTGVIVASGVTFEGTNYPDLAVNLASGAGSGWSAETAATTFAIAAAAGQNKQHWADYCSYRVRAIIVVTTAGPLELSVSAKGA